MQKLENTANDEGFLISIQFFSTKYKQYNTQVLSMNIDGYFGRFLIIFKKIDNQEEYLTCSHEP